MNIKIIQILSYFIGVQGNVYNAGNNQINNMHVVPSSVQPRNSFSNSPPDVSHAVAASLLLIRVGLLELAHLSGLLDAAVDLVRVLANDLQLDIFSIVVIIISRLH